MSQKQIVVLVLGILSLPAVLLGARLEQRFLRPRIFNWFGANLNDQQIVSKVNRIQVRAWIVLWLCIVGVLVSVALSN